MYIVRMEYDAIECALLELEVDDGREMQHDADQTRMFKSVCR